MKPNVNKLTPQVDKQLIALAGQLPQLQKLDKAGNPLFRANPKFKGTSEYSTDTRHKTSYTKHIECAKEPLLVNHLVNLRDHYQKSGMNAVKEYCDVCRGIATSAILKEAEEQKP